MFAAAGIAAPGSAMADASPAPQTQTRPAPLSVEQDHQRIMDLLGLKEIRSGANWNDPKAPNYVNYDESKANPYPKLPDPLIESNGKPVKSAKDWWKTRRAEIVELFDKDIYGRVPKNTPRVNWVVESTSVDKSGQYPSLTKHLRGVVNNQIYPQIKVNIDLTLTVPLDTKSGVPVMLQFFPSVPASGSESAWGQQLLAKGWGYAVLGTASVQADDAAGLSDGIIGLSNSGQPRSLDDWGVLRAWAWGASRALDYFETDSAVNAKKVGLEGHSRYGKATLVAMAYDQRFAIAYVSSSGEGGAKLFRRNFGEQMGNIAGGEYYWFAGNLLKYAGSLNEGDLPVDSHELIALCAPRPVFIGCGVASKGDGWVDPQGMFMATVAAGPVYKLLGKKGLDTDVFPPVETSLLGGDLAFRQQDGGHTDMPNWPYFIQFASRYFDR
jgi:hypothetical protein